MEISLAAEKLFTIGNFTVTNTLFTAFIIFALIFLLAVVIRRGLSYRNPGKFAVLIEMAIEGLYGLASDSIGSKHVKGLFAFVFTFFLFIFVSNWFGLLPIVPSLSIERSAEEQVEEGVESEITNQEDGSHEEEMVVAEGGHEQTLWECIKTQHCYLSTDGIREYHHAVHVLRAPTSDLSMTIALALISVIVTNVLGFAIARKAYLHKYINFKSAIDAFVGLLEIISEFGKIVSFSFRLFGNVFAGEILLVVITSISIGVATLPFLALEIFVGAIQAFVFFMLTSIFIGLAINHHEH